MPNEYSDFECLSNSNGEQEAFKQVVLEQKIVQRQIDARVAQIIRLTREVQAMTHCTHDPTKEVLDIKNVFHPKMTRRCLLCRAWLE